jgi:DNA-binding transcriptional regulator LsrR (DeoR family)
MKYSEELMYKAAKLYYKDNLKQESVARRLNISKYKAIRVLKTMLLEYG